MDRREIQIKTYAATAMEPIAPDDESVVKHILEAGVEDPDRILDASRRKQLISQLTAYLMSRAQSDSSAYMRIADNERGTRWLTPDDDEGLWTPPSMRYRFVTKSPIRRSDPREALAAVMDYTLGKEEQRIVAIGEGPRGCRVLIRRIQSRTQLIEPGLSKTEKAFWLDSATGSAIFFRQPRVGIEEIMRRDGGADVCEAYVLLRTQRGSEVVWNARWFWEPSSASWIAYNIQLKGPYNHTMEY